MRQIKFAGIVFILILITSVARGQHPEIVFDKEAEPESRRGSFYILPEISLWFGPYTNIEFAPQVGFHLSDRLSIGAGPHYIFYKNTDYLSPVHFSTHIWGIKAFSRLDVIKNASELLPFYLFDELFAHVEFETMSLENQYFNALQTSEDGRFWMEYFYVGGGISQRFSQKASYYFMLLWNLNSSFNSFYSNPTYRVGFCYYF